MPRGCKYHWSIIQGCLSLALWCWKLPEVSKQKTSLVSDLEPAMTGWKPILKWLVSWGCPSQKVNTCMRMFTTANSHRAPSLLRGRQRGQLLRSHANLCRLVSQCRSKLAKTGAEKIEKNNINVAIHGAISNNRTPGYLALLGVVRRDNVFSVFWCGVEKTPTCFW